ncbi:DUF2569 domain-containing protein [Acerihabitans sp. TG2]|uniref:DUF2569 domain-containing protein n=1 Tax=Acerihabitans sp. TG2 TaxID=3096008 RepID=UPI002B238928|nr:DUF2569 domain-containing protein [Acerihabitans sp. TG2]MEA9391128.1 DUF2569 domain-containing protein [Acerihabitans sp. TG2]
MCPKGIPCIGGWLWLPVSYLILTLLSASLTAVVFLLELVNHSSSTLPAHTLLIQWSASLVTLVAMWAFTFWTLRLLLRRSRRFPKIFIIWLLVGVLIALKTFAFSPVTDDLALRVLFWSLLAAAGLVPYIKRSRRVKNTFILP